MRRRHSRVMITAAILLAALVAIPDSARGQLTKVKVHLDWVYSGYHAFLFVAKDKGYYREVGLDVEIEPGQGSFDAVKVVGAGTAQFGIADAGTLSKAVSEGIPATMVAVVLRDSPMLVVSPKERNIARPKDLEGKSIGMASWEATMFVFPVFAKLTGVDTKKVTVVPLSFATKIPAMRAGRVDTLGGYVQEFTDPEALHRIFFKDHGVAMYSNGIITQSALVKDRPQVVRAFVTASVRALKEAVEDPERAIDIMLKYAKDEPKASQLQKFLLVLPVMKMDPGSRETYGWMDEKKWASTQEIMVSHGGQKTAVPLPQLFTNTFLK